MNLLTDYLQLRSASPHLAGGLLCLVKSSLAVGSTFLLTVVSGRRSALTRSWAWRGTIVGLLSLAFWEFAPAPLTTLHPTWQVRPAAGNVGEPLRLRPPLPPAVADHSASPGHPDEARSKPDVWRRLESGAPAVYVAGALLFALWHVVRMVAGWWWLRRSARPADARLQRLARDPEAGWRPPRAVAVCPGLATPLLIGWLRPTIYLPVESLAWTDAKLAAVFIHEGCHWRRRDGWWQTLGALTVCLWWWQPLAWLAVGRLRFTAEQVADDAVVLRQRDAAAYARTLVEIAASLPGRVRPAGVAMIGRSPLENRVRSLLRDNPWRGKHGKLGLALTVVLTGFFLRAGGVYLRSAETPPPASAADAPPSPGLARATPTSVPSAGVAKARVVNAQDEPIVGASIQPYTEVHGNIWSFPASKHDKTHTDPEGRFSYAVEGYTQVGVLIIARGYARRLADIPYDGFLHDVVLGPGVEVTGRLLKDGKPVPGIEVGIAEIDRSSNLGEIIAKTDRDGRFVLPDVAPKLAYEIHAKRDSLRMLGATVAQRVTAGEPGTSVAVGDLLVETGVVVTGRIMLPDGSLPDPDNYHTDPKGQRTRETGRSVQLHVYRETADDYQYIDLKPDLRFSFPALPGEKLVLSAWVDGYKEHGAGDTIRGTTVKVSADLKPIEMVYDPESAEAKERALHPIFTPPSTPTPAPPTAEQLAADAKAAQEWATKLAVQPHRSAAEWREQIGKVKVGMTWTGVTALLPPKTVSIDYMNRDEYDEKDTHTSFYGLDGEFAVALTFDFGGDEAWNAAGQPDPRPEQYQNHLIRPPVLLRHDGKPDQYNEITLDKARKVDPLPRPDFDPMFLRLQSR